MTTRDQILNLPKIDLHRHLEGSLRLGTLLEIARSEPLDVPREASSLRPLVEVTAEDPRTHLHFLRKFRVLRQFYRSPEILRRLTAEVIQDAALDRVAYLELHFTPTALASARGFPLSEVMDWVLEASLEAAAKQAIEVRLVASVNRHEALGYAEQVAALSAERREKGILGLDLAGDEKRYPAAPFAPIFAQARSAGLRLSVHAGEWEGAQSVRQALEVFQADRIVHGVRVMEDRDVAVMARERAVPFTACLTSNLQSGVVSTLREHPLPAMIQAGLQVSLATDDPSVSSITLSEEYLLAMGQLGLSLESLKGLLMTAVHASFLPPKRKTAREVEFRDRLFAGT